MERLDSFSHATELDGLLRDGAGVQS